MPQYVFIDESGDPGLTKGSSPYFCMAAVVFNNKKDLQDAYAIMDTTKKSLGWGRDEEYKFKNTKESHLIETVNLLTPIDFTIYGLFYNKDDSTLICGTENNYLQITLKLLDFIHLDDATISIDGRFGKQYLKATRTYLRKNLINGSFRKLHYSDSISSNGIQLADISVGAIARMHSKSLKKRQVFKLLKNRMKILEI